MVLALQFPEPTCPFKDPPPQTIDPLEHEVKYAYISHKIFVFIM